MGPRHPRLVYTLVCVIGVLNAYTGVIVVSSYPIIEKPATVLKLVYSFHVVVYTPALLLWNTVDHDQEAPAGRELPMIFELYALQSGAHVFDTELAALIHVLSCF